MTTGARRPRIRRTGWDAQSERIWVPSSRSRLAFGLLGGCNGPARDACLGKRDVEAHRRPARAGDDLQQVDQLPSEPQAAA